MTHSKESAHSQTHDLLFMVAVVGIGVFCRSYWGTKKRYRSRSRRDLSCCIQRIEARVQQDEGGRGIVQIIPAPPSLDTEDEDVCDGDEASSSSSLSLSHMEAAAKAMLACNHAVIMTGFPCLLQNDPPTETDGPLGTLCLARTLVALGKKVRIVTDECNEDVLLTCAAASQVFSMGRDEEGMPLLQLESFPGMATFDESDFTRLGKVRKEADIVIAVERAGPSSDGCYKTMTGKDMTAILAPLDTLLQPEDFQELDNGESFTKPHSSDGDDGDGDDAALTPTVVAPAPAPLLNGADGADGRVTEQKRKRMTSIGIGDGGNEVGMGAVYDLVCNSTIPLAADIACVVPTDHLLVSSVSNWGAYALSASVALLATAEPLSYFYGCDVKQSVDACMPSAEQEQRICQGAVAAGAGDGISGERKEWVDGMPLSTSLEVLQNVKDIAIYSEGNIG